MIAGSPMLSTNASASASVSTVSLSGVASPSRSQTCANSSRSSARWITARSAPIISIPCSWNTPWSQSSHAQFSAVCPPSVGRTASMGVSSSFSFSMILRTDSGVIGSM